MTVDGREIEAATAIAKRSIWFIAGLFLTLFLVFAAERFHYQNQIQGVTDLRDRAADVRSRILWAEEVLTGAARSYAAVSRVEQIDRYYDTVPVMENALVEALILANPDARQEFAKTTEKANSELKALQISALNYTKLDRTLEATAAVHSSSYDKLTERLHAGTNTFLDTIHKDIETTFQNTSRNRMMLLIGILLTCIASFSAVWVFVSKAMNKSERAFLAADAKIRNELSHIHDENIKNLRMAQMGQLTATVAHEIRNPLGAVRTSAFLLQRKLSGKGMNVESQIERINAGVVRCDNIITQLLDYSKTSTPKFDLHDFDGWLVKVIEEMAEALPHKLQITCSLDVQSNIVEFDAARLQRVVINLVNNASESMFDKAGATLPGQAMSPEIWVETNITARGVECRVRDNGPGIATENLSKIMDPLFTTKQFGTGLGLPAVRKILEQHGGGLELTSEVGVVTCFTAWFPHAQRQIAA